ncbi:PaaI family thioesterase [Streptomyces sp. JL4002]|uniref:PaaI family thioesterase n=1 Tax=Streptomyces TaxID=1883 RepID=UPI003B286DBF
MYSLVTGTGSPLSPPLHVTRLDRGATGTCALGVAHEGPPGYGHGGISAMLLDELMGWVCATAGMPGVTVSLQTRYHRPVPLESPLRVLAHVTGTEGRKVYVTGSIATEEDLPTVLVAAEGVFVSPCRRSRISPGQASRNSPGARWGRRPVDVYAAPRDDRRCGSAAPAP